MTKKRLGLSLFMFLLMAGTTAFAMSNGDIYLQAGSFKSSANAQNYKQKLSREVQYPVRVEEHGIYHVVRIGPIPTRAESKVLAAKLNHTIPVNTQKNVVVEPSSQVKTPRVVSASQRLDEPALIQINVGVMDKDAGVLPKAANVHSWYINGNLGYSAFQQAGDNSGGALVGRFAIGREWFPYARAHAGFEIGVQNGNRMSIAASQATLDEMGSLPIWTTVKPMMDLLATLRIAPLENRPAFLIAKGGIAYRQWETERQSINNLAQIAGELQLGVGMSVVERAMISLLYQGIYGSGSNFRVNPDSSGRVSHIPVQNGILLSLSLFI